MQHRWLFVLCFWLALLIPGWSQAPSGAWEWSEDARWELATGPDAPHYRLAQPLADFGLGDDAEEMTILPIGLLLRHRNRVTVNLTVLQGDWQLYRNQQALGAVGQSAQAWRESLGAPLKIFVNPAKVAQIYFYQASLADVGLMVAEDKTHSIMLVEPGYLERALLATGYQPQP